MARYTTVQQLIQEGDNGTFIDVITRINGRLHMVFDCLYFDEAVERVRAALEDRLEVECEEHEQHPGASFDLLPGELDRQS